MSKPVHYHVGVGVPGYGPDEPGPCYTLIESSEALSSEWEDVAQTCHDTFVAQSQEAGFALDNGADPRAVAEQFRDAFRAWEDADMADTESANVSTEKRSQAPAYKDKPGAWERELKRMMVQYPKDVTSQQRRVYWWDCSDPQCLINDAEDDM
jgi:hypothetical protein